MVQGGKKRRKVITLPETDTSPSGVFLLNCSLEWNCPPFVFILILFCVYVNKKDDICSWMCNFNHETLMNGPHPVLRAVTHSGPSGSGNALSLRQMKTDRWHCVLLFQNSNHFRALQARKTEEIQPCFNWRIIHICMKPLAHRLKTSFIGFRKYFVFSNYFIDP